MTVITTMINIRKAEFNDVAGITQCVHNAYQHYITRLGKHPGPMREDYVDIVGVLVLMEHLSPILLDNIAVDPNQQGNGPGRRLLLLAENIANDRGISQYNCIRMN